MKMFSPESMLNIICHSDLMCYPRENENWICKTITLLNMEIFLYYSYNMCDCTLLVNFGFDY